MSHPHNPVISRRSLLRGSASLVATLPLLSGPKAIAGIKPIKEFSLTAAPSRLPLVGPPYSDTEVWCYSGRVPGPVIRVRQGQRVRITVENRLAEETTVHWHGVRVPNAMDGVPHLTQKPIAPKESFVYEFDCPDAGTFWYHPHQRSFEQVGRGLYGPLIVDEPAPIAVE